MSTFQKQALGINHSDLPTLMTMISLITVAATQY